MKTIRQLLSSKPAEVWTIEPDATVYRALELLAEKDVGALPVVEGGRLVGIFSERDYARNIVLKGKSSKSTPVRELMTARVQCVGPEQTIHDCMSLMTARRIRHLPVFEDDQLVGIVTIGDVVKEVISEQGETIEQLESYIKGTPDQA